MSDHLSNIEMTLMQLISECGSVSGYEINKLIEERGYRKWAGIGTTSIYMGLKKLDKKGLVEYSIDEKKEGKGPPPKKFRLTGKGIAALKSEVLTALSITRERDRRFDLALASLPLVGATAAAEALAIRSIHLTAAYKEVGAKYLSDGGDSLPLHVRALFRHSLKQLENEMEFVDSLIEELGSEGL